MLNKHQYSLSQVEEILDFHIENDSNFLFVCDFALAHYIYDYLHNEYDIEADSLELSSDIDEYYISMSFYDDGDITFICEYAKFDQEGQYKYDECDNVDYYVFTDMSFGDAREFLNSRGEMQFCEVVGEEIVVDDDEPELCSCCNCEDPCADFNCTCENVTRTYEEVEDGNMTDNEVPCDCVDCKSARGEFTEDEELEIGLIEHYAQYIEEIECTCGSELRNILYNMMQECMSMGYENAKEELDDNTVNISIDNLTINSTGNVDNFVNQLKHLAKISR